MSEEILMNVTPIEARVALVENGVLQEVFIERERSRGIVGNIYLGKVVRVLPGMQAAFVDIGIGKASYLHVDDIVSRGVNDVNAPPTIQQKIREGDEVLVQVLKDPLGTKGARLTTDITIPSRYLVFMPDAKHVGVSQRIETDEERLRLKNIVKQYNDDDGGFIIRTAAEGASELELAHDAQFLKKLWQKIKLKRQKTSKAGILHEDLVLAFRTLRDFVGEDMERIRVDSKLTYQQLKAFTDEFVP